MQQQRQNEINEVREEVRDRLKGGDKHMLPVQIELNTLSNRVEVLQRDMKQALEYLAQDALSAIEHMEQGISPSLPDTRRIDDYKKQLDETEGQIKTLTRTVRLMFDIEEN